MNVPALRFKSADGVSFPQWDERTLGSIGLFFSGGTPLTTRKEFYDGGIPFIKSGELGSDSTAQSISELGLKNSSAKMVNKGDLLYALYGATSGEVAISRIDGAINQAILCIRANLNNYYLYSYLLFQKTNILSTYLQGGQGNLSAEIIKSLKVPIPSVEEQTKIADFLTAVDEKISQLTQKHELLNQYKKGVMQKIFSQELRFKDDDGSEFPEWAERKLGEVGEIVTGKTPSTAEKNLWNGEIQFVTPTDINHSKYQTDTARTVAHQAKQKVLPVGSIMFTCIASIGKMAISTKQSITNQQINSLIPKSTYYNEYVYYALLNIREFIKSTKSSSTLPIINKTEFSKFCIPIASIKEQTKIANFLKAIDDKITAAQSQLELVKQYKQGLLQQMFV